MGDPYYIADSGMGNYNAELDPASINLTKDGTIEYQRSEVDITLNFRTPIDTGENWMEFPGLGTKPVGAFSGVYRVMLVENDFSDGKFTQRLKCIRRKNQDTDTKAVPAQDGNGMVKDGDKENNLNESTDPTGNPTQVPTNKNDQKTSKTNSTGGGASQTTTSADTNKGSNPKPKEATVVNRIRGTL